MSRYDPHDIHLLLQPMKHLRFAVAVAVAVAVVLASKSAVAQSLFELAVRGALCKQNVQGSLVCNYKVGRDLEFSIAATGEADAGISFLRSNIKGDYYARFGVMHGCVIVSQGEAAAQSAPSEYAFVSPKNGRVYRTWQECQSAKE